jgi:hypothetical protein
MATCDYCGATYRGGAIKEGLYRFCTGVCHSRGKALLRHLDRFPPSNLDVIIAREHAGPCPSCGQNHSIDVHDSYRIWSAFIYSSWQTGSFVACQECARQRHREDLVFCAVAGWWSPRGIFVTPFFIVFNIMAMLRPKDRTVASDRFRKLIRMNLARRLASQQDDSLSLGNP